MRNLTDLISLNTFFDDKTVLLFLENISRLVPIDKPLYYVCDRIRKESQNVSKPAGGVSIR